MIITDKYVKEWVKVQLEKDKNFFFFYMAGDVVIKTRLRLMIKNQFQAWEDFKSLYLGDVWVLYRCSLPGTDEPAIIFGFFNDEEAAKKAEEELKTIGKNNPAMQEDLKQGYVRIQKFELNKILEKHPLSYMGGIGAAL